MKIQLKSYLQFKFHATGVIFTMVTMFPHFPPKCGACVMILIACSPILEMNLLRPAPFLLPLFLLLVAVAVAVALVDSAIPAR